MSNDRLWGRRLAAAALGVLGAAMAMPACVADVSNEEGDGVDGQAVDEASSPAKPSSCGNGACDTNRDESCETCPEDCGTCPSNDGPVCGNGVCEPVQVLPWARETCEWCPEDCGCCPHDIVCQTGCPEGEVECRVCQSAPGPNTGFGGPVACFWPVTTCTTMCKESCPSTDYDLLGQYQRSVN